MVTPTFAKRPLNRPIIYGSYHPNNDLLNWMSKQVFEYKYYYCSYKTDLYIRIPKVGWMKFTNNAAYPTSLYLMFLVINKPCKGHGTKQMEMLKKFSDDMHIPITLMCCPLRGSDPMRLKNFYLNLGFKKEENFYIYEKMEAAKEEYKHQVSA